MATKNESFHEKCGMLEVTETMMHDLRERRCGILDEMCAIMNGIFVSGIKDLGFRDARFTIDDFECEPELLLLFEESYSRKDFKTEEEWLDYQSANIELCYNYFEEQCPSLNIICLSGEEYIQYIPGDEIK